MANELNIREHMDVIGSCGTKVGVVDGVEGQSIKLTRGGPGAGGEHHYIPTDWVDRVDAHVHLKKSCDAAQREWKTEAVGAAG